MEITEEIEEQIKKLEAEYGKVVVPEVLLKSIKNGRDLSLDIDGILSELARSSKKVYRELLKNYIAKKWKNLVRRLFASDENLDEILEKDADYILELLIHIADNSELFAEIQDSITDENYEEVIRLTEFAVQKYLEQFNYLQGKRKSLEASISGITYIDGKEDQREAVKEFIRLKINEFTSVKYLEKKIQS